MQDSHLAGLMRRGRVRPEGDRHFVIAGTDEEAKSWVQISVALAYGTLVVHGLTSEMGETGRGERGGTDEILCGPAGGVLDAAVEYGY